MVTIKTTKTDLLKALAFLKVGVKEKPRNDYIPTYCEVTITDNKVTFSLPGCKYALTCDTQGTAKFSTNFLYFHDLIKHHKYNELFFEIENDLIKLGDFEFKVNTCFFEDDKILKSIKLPIKFQDKHLLNLKKEGYTKEEFAFNNLQKKIDLAELRLTNNINNALKLLSKYNVTRADIEHLVNSKLYK
jgi:hypothetical protein